MKSRSPDAIRCPPICASQTGKGCRRTEEKRRRRHCRPDPICGQYGSWSVEPALEVKLAAVLSGDASEDVPLRNGDVLTVRQIAQWNDLGSSVTVRGEVQHPASYGIEPGERLSSLLKRCGGFTPQAYPYGAVLIRREVRDLEMTSHVELVNRDQEGRGLFEDLARERRRPEKCETHGDRAD